MSGFERINGATAKEMMDQGEVNIADIRDSMSYTMGRIKGAVQVDNSSLKYFLENSSKDTPLIVCCYHGNSSQSAAQFFAEQGYEKVYSLDGGYEQWKVLYPEYCDA